jgi:hypothetical protein
VVDIPHIEVKTTLDRASLGDAFAKCGYIRRMAKTPSGDPNKSYAIQRLPEQGKATVYSAIMSGLPPRFFVFGYRGWESLSGLKNSFEEISIAHPDAHIHGVCNLTTTGSLFVQHIAFAKGSERYSTVQTDGFRQFVMAMPYHLNFILPPHRNGRYFDMVNVEYYQTQ